LSKKGRRSSQSKAAIEAALTIAQEIARRVAELQQHAMEQDEETLNARYQEELQQENDEDFARYLQQCEAEQQQAVTR
jgi:polyhydroxyalkanoate synthesis regulator protein